MGEVMGKVILVGAGPGDSGLLTIAGKNAIDRADVVLYDQLVGLGVLSLIPPHAQQIDVGKRAGNHRVPQEEMNRMIVEHAKQGKTVVRLKGGDPYLFGRGAEELEEIAALGIDFQVIPGITSAIAVPAYGGIPITHRDYSSSLHIVTGHRKNLEDAQIAYKNLVAHDGTLVFMMGVGELENICNGLLEAGIKSDMPAALIHRGSTNKQRTLVATVSNIVEKAQEQNFVPPCVFVVGRVASLSETFNWFEKQPLSQLSVLVSQPQNGTSRLALALREQGCTVVEIPAIDLVKIPMEQKLAKSIGSYDWLVFTSKFGVETFTRELARNGVDIRSIGSSKIAAVGAATEKVLNERGLLVDYRPQVYDAEHLAQGLKDIITKEDKVFLYRSTLGRDLLPEELRKLGGIVHDIPAYTTVCKAEKSPYLSDRVLDGDLDIVAFTSASTVEGFICLVGDMDYSKITAVCIGEQTAKAARVHGFDIHISDKASIDSMVEKIIQVGKGK